MNDGATERRQTILEAERSKETGRKDSIIEKRRLMHDEQTMVRKTCDPRNGTRKLPARTRRKHPAPDPSRKEAPALFTTTLLRCREVHEQDEPSAPEIGTQDRLVRQPASPSGDPLHGRPPSSNASMASQPAAASYWAQQPTNATTGSRRGERRARRRNVCGCGFRQGAD